jgi:hypothetical protein
VGTCNICHFYGGDTAWNGGDFPLGHTISMSTSNQVVSLALYLERFLMLAPHRIPESCVFQRCMIDTHDSSSERLLASFTCVNNVMWRVLMGFLLGFLFSILSLPSFSCSPLAASWLFSAQFPRCRQSEKDRNQSKTLG